MSCDMSCLSPYSGRVISAVGERMAPQYTPQTFSDSTQGTVLVDCLDCVCRTGRMETTGRKKHRREQVSISPDQGYKHVGEQGGLASCVHVYIDCEDIRSVTACVIRFGELSEKSGRMVMTISALPG